MHYLVEASIIEEMLLALQERIEDLEDQLLRTDSRAGVLSKMYKCHGMLRVVREEIRGSEVYDPTVTHAAVTQEGSDRT